MSIQSPSPNRNPKPNDGAGRYEEWKLFKEIRPRSASALSNKPDVRQLFVKQYRKEGQPERLMDAYTKVLDRGSHPQALRVSSQAQSQIKVYSQKLLR